MRKLLAILICKAGYFVGRLIGKGSSLPGKVALKLCPDILSRITLPKYIVAVTGSNGKTSTVEMIAAVLRADGRTVAYNAEGSNQIEGVTTLVLTRSTLGGRLKADVLLIESDERYAVKSFKYFHPTHFVITNLYRDQLTRNGHHEWVYDCILPALHDETTLILNADDPLSSCFGGNRDKVKWFGVERYYGSSEAPRGAYRDGAYCPRCKSPMNYSWYHYNQIGDYRCDACGHARPKPDYAVTSIDRSGELVFDDETAVKLKFSSIYNVYNSLATYALCRELGVKSEIIAGVIDNYILKNGRMVRFTIGKHHGTLLTSKHENSIGYDTNLAYIRESGECIAVVIVDSISRKYFTGETSWLWDIDFDLLAGDNVKKVFLCGKYVNDLAVRFSYTGVSAQKISCFEDIREAASALRESGSEEVFAVTCFTDKDKLLNETVREAE